MALLNALFFLRGEEEVHMVGHEHVGVELAGVFVAGKLELFEVEVVVGIGTEYFRAVVAAHDHMLRLVGNDESG